MTENNLKKLLSEMSLTEKIGELSQMPGEYYNTNVRVKMLRLNFLRK